MRKSVASGLFACGLVFTLSSGKSSAQTSTVTEESKPSIVALLTKNNDEKPAVLAVLEASDNIKTQEDTPAPVVVEHVVAAGESLSDIAKQYDTTWRRLFDKNTDIENPDVISVGQKIVVPNLEEMLTERALPEPPAPVVSSVSRPHAAPVATNTSRQAAYVAPASAGGNTYTAGYCTWYVKNRRPDLPNNLGNAETWVSRAAAQGLPTGSTPQAGAVGQRGNHVVYIESVNSDGSVNVSEMNFVGLYTVSNRTVAGNYFSYIY